MIEALVNIDKKLFLFFNHLNNDFFDFIFFWSSDKWIWIPFYLFLGWVVYKNRKEHFFIVLLFIAAAVAFSDQISSGIIKEGVMRLRPCHDPSIANDVRILNNYCGGKYGFISSHASNVFTLATFFSIIIKSGNKTLVRVVWLWAAIVSYSRIYIGVHFPGDILGGALLGIVSGNIFAKAYEYLSLRLKH